MYSITFNPTGSESVCGVCGRAWRWPAGYRVEADGWPICPRCAATRAPMEALCAIRGNAFIADAPALAVQLELMDEGGDPLRERSRDVTGTFGNVRRIAP